MKCCKSLSRNDLVNAGITIELDYAANDIRVYRNGKQVKLSKYHRGYLGFVIYPHNDTNKNHRTILLHRAIYAWVNGFIPDGKVIDHISNKHAAVEDYFPENLQAITQEENANKDRICSVRELKCDMRKPRSFYEGRLKKYEALHEQAKKEGKAEEAYKRRKNISDTKARLRYWDSHVEEFSKYNAKLELKKFLKGQIEDLLNEIDDQKANNVVCEQNGWDYFRDLGVWIIKNKRGKIRELKKELRELE